MEFLIKELQTLFIESRGQPISFNGKNIVQIDCINIHKTVIDYCFLSNPNEILNGFALKIQNGYIELSNGKKVNIVYTWNQKEVPNIGHYSIVSSDNKIKIWNIYHVNSKELTIADYWTNNAGMIVDSITNTKRIYYCSDGIGIFDPNDNIFSLSWIE